MTTKVQGSNGIEFPDATQQSTAADMGPAFRASTTLSTSVPSYVWTRVQLDVEEFDTANCFAGNRFTPNVPGYYSITGQVQWGSTTGGNAICAIYRNGVAASYSAYVAIIEAGLIQSAATLVYCNGTTDYIELFAVHTNPSPLNVVPACNLTGFLARKA